MRSRKTTSDFDRALRQQQVLLAIKEKALSAGVLTSPGTLTDIYNSIQNNMNTDMELRELITMAKFATHFDRNNLVMKVLNDDPERDGGFLYVPLRDDYDGLYVLVPFGGDFKMIQRYASLLFHHGMAMANPARLEVLNASGASGAARKIATQLTRYGFDVVNIDDYLDAAGNRIESEKTFIQFNQWTLDRKERVVPALPLQIKALEEFLSVESIPSDQSQDFPGADLSIVIGSEGLSL
ncbi:LCP family protein [Candidatus Peregrinibacteria bacterium]|nr:MAG: LCP family protein [Candidatus Peregrinibacteria bacterium]